MKIDSTDIDVFPVKVSHADSNAWLLGDLEDLETVNSAIDEAVSFAVDNGRAFVLIEISKPSTDKP